MAFQNRYLKMNPATSPPFYSSTGSALFRVLAIQILILPAVLAQTTTNQTTPAATSEPVKLPEVIVTGRLTPTTDSVGPAPLQTITAEDIQKTGALDIMSALLKINPSFTGSLNGLGNVNNNAAVFNASPAGTGESFAALRNLPTLILLDGRRVASSPLSGGQGVDLNLIPVSMIARIEVLEDGASALYGSDAVGGVINIITKKDYNGAEIALRIGFATDPGSGQVLQYQTSVVAGSSTENTRVVFAGQFYHMDPLLEKDRQDTSPAALNAAGILPFNNSPLFPGRADDVITGNLVGYVLAGSPLAAGAPGYRPGVTTPPIISGGPFSTVAAYNAAATSQLGYAPYVNLATIPLTQQFPVLASEGYALLDPAQFGTYSLLRQDRDNLNLNVDHDLFGKRMTLFGDFMYTHDESQAELAPAPLPFLEQANILVPANNPYNPFGIGLGGASSTPVIRSRFEESGNRIYDTYSDAGRAVGGVKGLLPPDYSYEVAGVFSREDQSYVTENAISGAALNKALIPNGQVNAQGQPLSMLTDANGNPVPVFNVFGTGGNSPATLNALRTSLYEDGTSDLWSVDAKVVGTPSSLELPAGPVAFALGGEFIHEGLSTSVDPITLSGLAPGLLQTFPTSGSRSRYAAYTEVNIPIFSRYNRIPGFYSLEFTAAGRYEAIQPGGSTAVPKVGLLWQPIDNQLTLRGGYSEGFIAPSIYNLYGPLTVSVPNVKLPDGTEQEQITTASNPNLPPSTSAQWNGGAVFSPKALPGLTVTADFYHIQEDKVPVADYTAALASLNALGSASPYAGGYTSIFGPLTNTAPNQVLNATFNNLTLPVTASEAIRTEGLDLSTTYSRLLADDWGRLTLNGAANWDIYYEVQATPGAPYYHYEGQGTYGFGTAQGIIPDYSINCSLTWDYRNFRYVLSAHYIPGVTIPGNLFPSIAGPGSTQGSTVNGLAQQVGSYYTLDMQLSYEFGRGRPIKTWYDGLRLTAGCNNITDNIAPLIAGGPENYTDKNVYDILGRFVYFEISKKF